MRHIRTRRRLKAILTALFAVSIILFLEDRVESFAPQMRSIVENKIEDSFDRSFKLSIGSLEGGLLRPFILNDVKVKGQNGAPVFSSFEITSLKSNYRVWDILLNAAHINVPIFGAMTKIPRVDVDFVTKNKELIGHFRFRGNVKDAEVRGYVVMFEKEKFNFAGKLRHGSFNLQLKSKKGLLKVEGSLAGDGRLVSNVKVDHLKFLGSDIVCEAMLKSGVVRDENDPNVTYLDGEVEMKNFIFNYTPFFDFKGNFRIFDGVLYISDLLCDNGIGLNGTVTLKYPFNMDLVCTVDNLNLAKVYMACGGAADPVIVGFLNAKICLKGPLNALKTDISMNMKKGRLNTMEFDSLDATLRGDGPVVRIEESRIQRQSGSFSLAGEMDLRRFGKNMIFQDVKIVSSEKAILWDDWTSDTKNGVQTIEMTKKMSEELNVGFKKYVSDNAIDESMRDRDEMALEYKVQQNDSLKLSVSDNSNFFGFEHKDKF